MAFSIHMEMLGRFGKLEGEKRKLHVPNSFAVLHMHTLQVPNQVQVYMY